MSDSYGSAEESSPIASESSEDLADEAGSECNEVALMSVESSPQRAVECFKPISTNGVVELAVVNDQKFNENDISHIISFKVEQDEKCLIRIKLRSGEELWTPFENVNGRQRIVEWLTRAGLESTQSHKKAMSEEEFERRVALEAEQNMSGNALFTLNEFI